MPDYEDGLYEIKGRVAIATLNRPEKMNALSHRLRGELLDALTTAEADENVRAVIIRGCGALLFGRLRPHAQRASGGERIR